MEANRQRMEKICEKLPKLFESNDLDEAYRLTATLQYLHRIDETLREKIDVS
jgi:hypothetical protein